MEKLGVEQNRRTLGCDRVFGKKKKLGKEKGGRFLVIKEH
jgi:hypothetical protein